MKQALLCLLLTTAWASPSTAQDPASTTNGAPVQTAALSSALLGQWVGVLEYRDYSEPAASLKRVQLPTWLAVSQAREGLSLDYTYDDGPSKIVHDHSTLVLDGTQQTYKLMSTDAVAESYRISGLPALRNGLGVLQLTGPGTENKLPVDIRTTWTIRRNLLSWLEEIRPAGSQGEYAFRHRYTFTRAKPPAEVLPQKQ